MFIVVGGIWSGAAFFLYLLQLISGLMEQKKDKKKLLYIMGCGRSGTTIMGFVLGNGECCLDLGEATDFLKREGEPNGFGPETANGKFWAAVAQRVLQEIPDIFKGQNKAELSAVERHERFLPLILNSISKEKVSNYKRYAQVLYDNIAREADGYGCFIDSSKYPGRGYLLSKYLDNFDVYIVHLVRDPAKVVKSFGDKDKNQGYKNIFHANIYYFVINFFCFLVRLSCGKDKYIKVKYEDVVSSAEDTLQRISNKSGIDFDVPIKRIKGGEPLRRGYIFNGNRMRMKQEVTLKGPSEPSSSLGLGGVLTMLCNYIWYK